MAEPYSLGLNPLLTNFNLHMFKTNFTRAPKQKWAFLCFLLVVLGYTDIVAQPMACNDLVHVSMDVTPNICQATVNTDMILEGDPIVGHDYEIEVKHNFTIIASGVNEVTITNAGQWLGVTLTTILTDLTTGNSCWGSMILEDKFAPVITCSDVTVGCADPQNAPAPDADDNCDPLPSVQMTGETTNTSTICTNGYATITRTYVLWMTKAMFLLLVCRLFMLKGRMKLIFPAILFGIAINMIYSKILLAQLQNTRL